jgi:hypothetical protein
VWARAVDYGHGEMRCDKHDILRLAIRTQESIFHQLSRDQGHRRNRIIANRLVGNQGLVHGAATVESRNPVGYGIAFDVAGLRI